MTTALRARGTWKPGKAEEEENGGTGARSQRGVALLRSDCRLKQPKGWCFLLHPFLRVLIPESTQKETKTTCPKEEKKFITPTEPCRSSHLFLLCVCVCLCVCVSTLLPVCHSDVNDKFVVLFYFPTVIKRQPEKWSIINKKDGRSKIISATHEIIIKSNVLQMKNIPDHKFSFRLCLGYHPLVPEQRVIPAKDTPTMEDEHLKPGLLSGYLVCERSLRGRLRSLSLGYPTGYLLTSFAPIPRGRTLSQSPRPEHQAPIVSPCGQRTETF